jgi:hypothetical protein
MTMRYEHKAKIFMAPLLYLTRTENPLAVSIYQDAGYQPGMICILIANAVVLLNACCVKLFKEDTTYYPPPRFSG